MADVDLVHIPEYLTARESAKRRDRLIQIASVSGALICLAAAGMMLGPINQIREESQLTINPDEIKGLPPDIALMTKTGTLRLLALNTAFARMERLKSEGKFYELMQLSSWVCKLAPYYPHVWSYAAWNQAYNISVSEYNYETRWKWVSNGISLLRDDGIQYNPKAILLYKELAWIYWHKVADFSDDAHWVYKRHIAVNMERVLGTPVPTFTEEQSIDVIRRIAQAPDTPERLIAQDAEVAQLVERLKTVGLTPDTALLDFVARNMRSQIQLSALQAEAANEDESAKLRQDRLALLTDPAHAEPLERLLNSVRHQALRKQLNLDPNWMAKLMEDYGPLDWRSAYSHALYWASLGDMVTKGALNLDPSDSMNTVRFIFFALMNSIQRGRMVLEPNFDDPGQSFLDMVPDTRFVPHLFEAYLVLGKEQFGGHEDFREGTPGGNYWGGFVNWLRDTIRDLYLEGGSENVALAGEYLDYLRRMHKADDGSIREEYLMSLDDFAMGELRDILISFKRANAAIAQLLMRSLRELSLGRDEASATFLERAEWFWKEFMKENEGSKNVPEPLNVMRRDAIIEFMKSPTIPAIYKARLWDRLDTLGRQMSYDELLPWVTELCRQHSPPLALERVMPEPPGMEQYRLNPVVGRQRAPEEAQQGTKKFDGT